MAEETDLKRRGSEKRRRGEESYGLARVESDSRRWRGRQRPCAGLFCAFGAVKWVLVRIANCRMAARHEGARRSHLAVMCRNDGQIRLIVASAFWEMPAGLDDLQELRPGRARRSAAVHTCLRDRPGSRSAAARVGQNRLAAVAFAMMSDVPGLGPPAGSPSGGSARRPARAR